MRKEVLNIKNNKILESDVISLFTESTLNMQQTAKKLGTTPTTVRNILIRNNVPTKKPNILRYRKYNVNDAFFTIIDSHEKAYILGLMYADGYLVKEGTATKRVGIDLIDKTILEEISKIMEFEGDIVTLSNNKTGYGSTKTLYRLKITSPQIYDDLIKLGCLEHKTYKIIFPSENIVPKEYINSFILGYLDGDGCITYTQRKPQWGKEFRLSFTGTEEFTTGILKQLKLQRLKKDKRWDNGDNITSIQIAGNQQIYKILRWLYSDSTIYLNRKYEKFIQLEKQISRAG